jgi:hypothetical protein
MTLPTQLLSYAPRRRRWVLRWMKRSAAVLVLLAIFAAEWRFGPAGWHSARIWYWERECMNLDPPAGAIAFEALPPGSAKPLAGGAFVDGDDPEVVTLGVSQLNNQFDRLPWSVTRFATFVTSRPAAVGCGPQLSVAIDW